MLHLSPGGDAHSHDVHAAGRLVHGGVTFGNQTARGTLLR
jgi:hypothetical protein